MDNIELKGTMSEEELIKSVQPSEEAEYLREQVKKRDTVIKRQRKEIGALRDISELFGSAIRSLPPPDGFNFRMPENDSVSPAMAQLCLADFHAEETVNYEEMEGYAEFNWDIFKARAWQTTVKAVELVDLMRHSENVPDICVFLMGDMVTGDIHADIERNASMALPMAITETADIIAQMMNYLSAHFKNVYVYGMCGNHGRKDLKPVTKKKSDRNWDTSVYHIARKITRENDRIHWTIPKSPNSVVEVPGVNFLLKHGDGIKQQGVTPYYGLVRDTSREIEKRRRNQDFDYVIQGHLHHFGITEGNRILCPSLIGPNEFSFNLLHATYPPEQLLMFTTEEHGLIDLKPIKLEDADGDEFLVDEMPLVGIE